MQERIKIDNIASMLLSTSIALIFTELTAVIAIVIDGVIASRFLGVDAYSGISMLGPLSGMVLMLAGFISTGCTVACSQLVGIGEKEHANEAFNLSALLCLVLSALVMIFCVLSPTTILHICGVPLSKYPELNPYMYDFLKGYMVGFPVLMLIQVIGPILTMDGGKNIFTVSSIVLCAVDIVCDLLNVFVFHGGTFGMGLASSISYLVQFLIILIHFVMRRSYFHFSLKFLTMKHLKEILKNGSPAFVKKIAKTLRDVLINYINIMVALSAVAIAARGIQGDLYELLICIPTGIGRAMMTMAGIYFAAGDLKGLTRLYSYAFRLGFKMTGIASVIVFLIAPLITKIYTNDPEVTELAVFSLRWIAAGLLFDMNVSLIQYYLQGIGSRKAANSLSIGDRLIIPVLCALILGSLFGSKGILASVAVSKMVLLVCIFLADCVRCKGLPKRWMEVMFLPKDFGGAEEDNMYAEVKTMDDVVQESKRTYDFCLGHGVSKRSATLMSLFVEEMAADVILRAAGKKKKKEVRIDYRLFVEKDSRKICFSMMDLCEHFDPTTFFTMHQDDPEKHIGIRLVTKMAKDIRYYNTFNSNNLFISIGEEDKKR